MGTDLCPPPFGKPSWRRFGCDGWAGKATAAGRGVGDGGQRSGGVRYAEDTPAPAGAAPRFLVEPIATQITGLTPHELQHTAANLAVAEGANVKATQRMLGNASAATTLDVYADRFEDDVDQVADRLDRAAGRAG
ncbi:hypothetical protein OOJ91_13545 [Micromonospora lupini]|uniref:hypothetical protein n=1 Tax=Micromonospora lupini TaxID=285679 RepID=UPI002257A23C|nr:hypothetical protein [Micromonospora lupini]MCX5066870.1 hypothetical protein [Micromonospora lupini]